MKTLQTQVAGPHFPLNIKLSIKNDEATITIDDDIHEGMIHNYPYNNEAFGTLENAYKHAKIDYDDFIAKNPLN